MVRHSDHDGGVTPESRPQKLLGRLVSPVVDAVDPDSLLERVDLNDLVERIDIDAALNRVDLNRLVGRIDLDALLQRIDVDAIVQRVDINAIVQRVDINAIVQRVDIEEVVDRVDVDGLIQRVDVDGIVKRVRISSMVADTASQLSARSIEVARRTVAHVDGAVLQPIDRAAGRADDPDRTEVARLAGPIARLGAWFLDTIVISLSFTAAVAVGAYLVDLFTTENVDPTKGNGLGWVGAGTLWGGMYLFFAWFLAQRTVGMAVFGIRLTRSDGSLVRARDSFIRVIVFPFSFIFGLGLIGIVIGRRRRALHDVAAGTLVPSDVNTRQQMSELAVPPSGT
jgi:uncharacterized RDD family membrane protein YckC